jgi:flagellar biosynthesis protein FliR
MPSLSQIKQLLKNHYSVPLKQVFKTFRLGLALFFVGLVIVYMAYQTMPESLLQEVVMLIGLLVLGIGFLMGMLAQIRMLIIRIVGFIKD